MIEATVVISALAVSPRIGALFGETASGIPSQFATIRRKPL